MPLNTPGFDFASRDYENIRRDLLLRAERIIPEWTDRDPSDFTMMLIDLWAYMGDIMHYYVDRAAGEAFIETATQKESVLALANLFDYTPRTRTPARLTTYVSNSSSSSVSLPAGTVFIGEGTDANYEFYSTSSTTINAGQTAAIACVEGQQITNEVLTTSATGQIGQTYTISNDKVVPSTVRVYVYEDGLNPTEWTRLADVNLADPGVSGFSVYATTEGYTEVVFGNRISGRVPPPGAKITVDYSSTNGEPGNIGINKILGFKSSSVSGIAVTSSTVGVGGSSGESIDSIKRSIKAAIQTQSRAVTLQDYVDIALQITGVYKAVASYTVDPLVGGLVSVYAMPYIPDYYNYTSNSITVENSVRTTVANVLQQVSMLGISVQSPSTITVVPKNIQGTIYVNQSYVQADVMRRVDDVIDTIFSIENIEFGKDIRIGDLYRRIHAVEGVDYATLEIVVGATPTNVQIVRKGTVNLTPSGGITTVI